MHYCQQPDNGLMKYEQVTLYMNSTLHCIYEYIYYQADSSNVKCHTCRENLKKLIRTQESWIENKRMVMHDTYTVLSPLLG